MFVSVISRMTCVPVRVWRSAVLDMAMDAALVRLQVLLPLLGLAILPRFVQGCEEDLSLQGGYSSGSVVGGERSGEDLRDLFGYGLFGGGRLEFSSLDQISLDDVLDIALGLGHEIPLSAQWAGYETYDSAESTEATTFFRR